MQDINAISYAWTPEAAVLLRNLFFLKWECHADPAVLDATANFKTEWCNARLSNWTRGHAPNSVVNTNGLESTNKVIKDELTFRQLMPVLDFLRKGMSWLKEQSELRDDVTESDSPNVLKFAKEHTFSTKDWTLAHAWEVNSSNKHWLMSQLTPTVHGTHLMIIRLCISMYSVCGMIPQDLSCTTVPAQEMRRSSLALILLGSR